MSKRGVFAVDRRLFDHPAFKCEPFTEREAWIWMIGEAAWQPTIVRINRQCFELERGQFVHAARYLAKQWQWSASRVWRFLQRLKNEGMIETHPETDATIVTISKYCDYQFGSRPTETPSEMQADTATKRWRNREEEGQEGKKEDAAHTRHPVPSSEAFELATAYRKAVSVDADDPQWIGLPYTAQVWVTRGYDAAVILAFGSALAARYGPKPMSYHAKAIENEMSSVKKTGAGNAQNRQSSYTNGGANGTGFASAAIFHARAASET